MCHGAKCFYEQQVHACADEYKISGAHLTFNLPEEGDALGDLGFLRRTGIQYHWANTGYSTFDDFLMDLKQSKRNNIRKVQSVADLSRNAHELARDVKGDLMHARRSVSLLLVTMTLSADGT